MPHDDAWPTYSWVVHDPQFVGKWGCHVALDSDGTTHSHDSIRRVTVSKA